MAGMTIEQLLTWAFVHELPKGGGEEGISGPGSAWSSITRFGELGVLDHDSGRSVRDWRPPFILEQGDPDPDALVIGRAVAWLSSLDFMVPDGWDPLSDWKNLDARGLANSKVIAVMHRVRARSRAVRGQSIQALVVSHAALSRRPKWACPEPGLRDVCRSGKPAWFVKSQMAGAMEGQVFEVEVDGWDKRRGNPRPGAYRKQELTDDPHVGIMDRMDWQVWVSALARLERYVAAEGMKNHHLQPLRLASEPWGASGHPVARVV